jgi:hypothetical protein
MNKKEIEKDIRQIMTVVNKPKYICVKCARASNEKRLVCKPVKIKDNKSM